MKKIIIAALTVAALVGCSSANDVANNEEAFSETFVGDTRCVVFKPSASSYEGTQMDCDFYGEKD